MKARIVRYVFATHRWSGVVLGLLMLVWCVSGIVMIWTPYPATQLGAHDYRVEGLAPIKLPDQLAFPEIPDDAFVTNARIEMSGTRPTINLAWRPGISALDVRENPDPTPPADRRSGSGAFNLETGERIRETSEAEALAIAGIYADRHGIEAAPSIKEVKDLDEFTVQGSFRAPGPYYQVRLNDADKTMLYVSTKSGDIRQRTTASLRFWAWAGAIPHWLYFTELRRDGRLWNNVVVYTSLAGCFLTVIGLFVGIRQFRKRNSTGKLSSPYRGAKFWHHMLGLMFGLLVLTWTFSGFASMNPWGWLESGPQGGQAAERLAGDPPTWDQMRPALEAQAAVIRANPSEITQVSFSQLRGGSGFMWRLADGSRTRVQPNGRPAPFSDALQQRAAMMIAGEGVAHEIELMQKPDAYYYPDGPNDLPVVRITVPSLDDTRFYLDATSADILYIADPGARGFRWWHSALHRIDIVPSPWREIIVVLLMLGVTAVCALGAWMGIKKLARGGKLDNIPEA